MKKSYEIDMCHGPLLGKLFIFALPLMGSGILELMFNAADIIVVGRFTGAEALAAVGATSTLITSLVNIFMGVAVGVNVLAAQYYGAGDRKNVEETVHTSILLGFFCGFCILVVGILFAENFLKMMSTPDDILGQAVLYMRIYFLGMPAFMVYNFGAALLRATGDTKRPLYFLFAAGALNVALNLLFVIAFQMGVAGVALATAISQTVSAALIIRCLRKEKGGCHLEFRKLHMQREKALRILKIGVPAGVQSGIFSISNLMVQSAVNSFGSIAVAGITAASNIEGFVYTAMSAVYQTALSFISQNMGAKNYQRVSRILQLCLGIVAAIGLVIGNGTLLFGKELLGIYSSNQEVVAYGLMRMEVVCTTYFLCGIMDVIVGSLRGMGYSFVPMMISLLGVCGFRIVWILTVFAWEHTLFALYISYPISWIITSVIQLICWKWIRGRYTEAISP